MWSISSISKKSSLFLGLALVVGLAHFATSNPLDHRFINFDDFLFITPMLKLSLKEYFTEWLPSPFSYAFPLRDLTLFGDHYLSGLLGIQTFWITQYLLLLVCCFFAYRLFCLYFTERGAIALLCVFALHPINVELVQWASSRRNILVCAILFAGTEFVLRRSKQGEPLNGRDWLKVFGFWIASLLVYPNGLIWIFAVIWINRQHLVKPGSVSRSFAPLLKVLSPALILAILYLAWTQRESSDFGTAGSSFFKAESLLRAWYFGVRSLGRGFFNFVFPFKLAPYYDESHWANWTGLLALCATTFVGVFAFLAHSMRKEIAQLLLFATVLFVPQGLVFLAFPDFVWADRYLFIVSPFALLVLTLLFWPQKPSYGVQLGGVAALAAWLSASTLYTAYRAPLWRDDRVLFKECADYEQSPRCLMEVIQLNFHQSGCGPIAGELALARQRYQSDLPKYGTVFSVELPFYDAACMALSTKFTPEEKLDRLPQLFDVYKGSAEIIFAITLTHLARGDAKAAFESAKRYYLEGHPERLRITKALTTVYLGHSKALCEIEQSPECQKAYQILVHGAEDTYRDAPLEAWAYQITRQIYGFQKPGAGEAK